MATERPARPRISRTRLEAMIVELKSHAEELGVRVREEKLLGDLGYRVRSGSCRLREENLIFLSRDLPPVNRIEILVGELAPRGLEERSLSDDLRHYLGLESNG